MFNCFKLDYQLYNSNKKRKTKIRKNDSNKPEMNNDNFLCIIH